jgi:PEGA domain
MKDRFAFAKPAASGEEACGRPGEQISIEGGAMSKTLLRLSVPALVLTISILLPVSAFSQNRVMSRLRFEAHGWTDRTAGVWVDGQYVGYVKELHGDKTVFLLPGKHQVQVREAGYGKLTQNLVASPGQTYLIAVKLQPDPSAHYSSTPAVVKIHINPGRAAVFVDGMYAGHADEFDGHGDQLLLNPGKHKIDVALPGYRAFTTEVSLQPKQVFKVETSLVPGSVLRADANLRETSEPSTEE